MTSYQVRVLLPVKYTISLRSSIGPKGDSYQESFESVSKNLRSYPYTITYSDGKVSYIDYVTSSGNIRKQLIYTGENVTAIVLSGATPDNIALTKSLTYTDGNITEVSYS